MSYLGIPFDPDFDELRAPTTSSSARPYFVFGVVAGLTLAAIIGIVLNLSS